MKLMYAQVNVDQSGWLHHYELCRFVIQLQALCMDENFSPSLIFVQTDVVVSLYGTMINWKLTRRRYCMFTSFLQTLYFHYFTLFFAKLFLCITRICGYSKSATFELPFLEILKPAKTHSQRWFTHYICYQMKKVFPWRIVDLLKYQRIFLFCFQLLLVFSDSEHYKLLTELCVGLFADNHANWKKYRASVNHIHVSGKAQY